jgi:hypothetical protein
MGDDVDALEEHRLDRFLPGPQRERVITQRTKVGVENESRKTVVRNVDVQSDPMKMGRPVTDRFHG